jgi:hypothetical protein
MAASALPTRVGAPSARLEPGVGVTDPVVVRAAALGFGLFGTNKSCRGFHFLRA